MTTDKSKFRITFSTFLFLFTLTGIGYVANSAGLINSPEAGYLVCVDIKTKIITHPGHSTCPKGKTKLILGSKGTQGLIGLTGAAGLQGSNGKDGNTLWNGVTDPIDSWGQSGDVYLNTKSKYLFGPKSLDNKWTLGFSLVGTTGLDGSSGPRGAAGATGATGAAGAAGQGPVYINRLDYKGFDTSTPEIALELNLPAGKYFMSFTGLIYVGAGTEYFSCIIDGVPGTGSAIMVDTSINDGRAFISRNKVLDLTTAREVPLNCSTTYGSIDVDFYDVVFTALKLSDIEDQTVG